VSDLGPAFDAAQRKHDMASDDEPEQPDDAKLALLKKWCDEPDYELMQEYRWT